MKLLLLLLLLISVAFSGIAQTRGRGTSRTTRPTSATVAPAKTEGSSTPSVPTSPVPPDTTIPTNLATLNGQTITVYDLEPSVTKEIATLGEKIAQARREMLEVQINTMLLDLESKKRKTTAQAMYDKEVAARITTPSDADINATIARYKAQSGEAESSTMRTDVINYLKSEQEQRLSEEFVNRLKQTTPVAITADLNGADLKPDTVIATVGGQPILSATLEERMKPVIYKLRFSAYQVTRDALDRTLNDMLLLAEAKRRNIPPEDVIRTEVTDKVTSPTDAEVEKFYNENKERINGDLGSVKYQIATYLRDTKSRQLEGALSERLRKTADVKIFLHEPEALVQTINTSGEPSRGDANAPVTVVEFTDFQCPACAAMQPVLDQVLPTFGTKVRFVVRNYPLAKHANARKAAEAADAANAQGKFFEYTAILFKRQDALDVPSLKKYATEVGLDRARFDSELDNGVHAADVKHDLNDGEIYGIDATPTVFINGVKLMDYTPEGLTAAINKALAKVGRK